MANMLGSIRLRIAAYVLLIVAAFAALGLFVIREVDADMRSNTESYLASEAQIVANSARPLLEAGAPQSSFDALAKQVGAGVDTRVTIIALDGTVLGDSEADPATMENHAGRPEVQAAMQSGSGKDTRSSSTLGVNFSYVARTGGRERRSGGRRAGGADRCPPSTPRCPASRARCSSPSS